MRLWKHRLIIKSVAILSVIFFTAGCSTINATSQGIAKESALTPGMTKKFIYPGKTTQTEILEVFGSPDLVTHKDGKDVWTYDKISHEVSASGGYLTILIAGVSNRTNRQTSKSVLLIIYFDRSEVVTDYRLSAAKF